MKLLERNDDTFHKKNNQSLMRLSHHVWGHKHACERDKKYIYIEPHRATESIRYQTSNHTRQVKSLKHN